MLGSLARVPVVALNYDPKVGHLMNRLGLGAHLLELGTLRSAALLDVIESALTTSGPTLERLDGEVTRLTNLARQNAVEAVACLERGARATHGWNGDAISLVPEPWRARLRDRVTATGC